MWQRFSESARRVVFFAQQEAERFGVRAVTPEHLLLGVTRDGNNVASVILQRLGLPPEALHKQLQREEVLRQEKFLLEMARGVPRPVQDVYLSEEAKQAIDQSYKVAEELGNKYIGTEHLLAGILRQGKGPAVKVLAALGIDDSAVRQQILAYEEPEQKDQ